MRWISQRKTYFTTKAWLHGCGKKVVRREDNTIFPFTQLRRNICCIVQNITLVTTFC